MQLRATGDVQTIVFFICISNSDDHLRNHGFILHREGWVLSPAFDINPIVWGDGLSLNISETDNAQDLTLAKDVAKYFGIDDVRRSNAIIREVVSSVKDWRKVASSIGICAKETDKMERAFRVTDTFSS
ncbi:MAG: HipA domain-containing protein [Pseudomonadota bacterium]|nr:HipA domain-containing protein [Pseudomonadota bacterium]